MSYRLFPSARKNTRLAEIARGASIAVVAMVGIFSGPAAAQQGFVPADESWSYRISLGGVVVAEADFNLATNEEDYRAAFELESDGVADWFTDALVRTDGSGLWTSRGDLNPLVWLFHSTIDDKAFDLEVEFSSAGPNRVTAEPPFRPRDWEIDPQRQYGAVDPMTAVVNAMHPDDADSICERSFQVFDGRRRYDLVFGDELRRDVRNGAVEIDCAVAWRRIAGFRPRDMRKPDFEFTLRMRMLEDGRALPVRAWTDTEFGGLIAVLD